MSEIVSRADADRLRALCCTPLLAAELSAEDADLAARALKALADPVRLRILALIRASAGGRATTTALSGALKLTQPTVSHHLQVLLQMGFLRRSREGRETWYLIESAGLQSIRQLLDPAVKPLVGLGAGPVGRD